MKVIVKEPDLKAELCEVESISQINKLVGNVDENGNGLNRGGSDIRMDIGKGVDLYVKEDALNNISLGENLWAPNNNAVFCGTIVFAGFDYNKYDIASLSQEQIDYCLNFIMNQKVKS